MNKDRKLTIAGKNYKEQGTINFDKMIEKGAFKFFRDGTRWGIAAGVGMAAFLVVTQLMNMGDSIAIKFFKYLILAGVVAFGLSIQRSYLQEEYNFKNGIKLGAYTTFISAITLSLMNIFMFLVTDNLAFDKFSVDGNTFGNVVLISGVLFFEVLVFGMVATFCVLQFIKPKRIGAKTPT